MTKGEKLLIAQYRAQGMGYTVIADALGLSKNTVKSFCQRNSLGKDATTPAEPVPDRICRQCGAILEQPAHRKTRRFCSEACRLTWWHAHRDHGRNAKRLICPACQKEFVTDRRQKYCSHTCYISARFGRRKCA